MCHQLAPCFVLILSSSLFDTRLMLFADSIVLISGGKNDVYVKVMLAVRTAKLSSPVRIFSLA